MGRLIDADALIEELELHCHDECKPNSIGYIVTGAIRDCMQIVNRQPIAYDVDAVVEQIMVLHDEGYCPNEDGLECVLDKACSDCYREKVTDIVRNGGKE